jgi:hypothetical protein
MLQLGDILVPGKIRGGKYHESRIEEIAIEV